MIKYGSPYEAPDELLNVVLKSILNIITNLAMDSSPLMSIISGVSLAENKNSADNASVTSGFNPFAHAGPSSQTEEQPVTHESTHWPSLGTSVEQPHTIYLTDST